MRFVAALLLLASSSHAKPAPAPAKSSPPPAAPSGTSLDASTAPVTSADVIARFETIDRQLNSLRARYRQLVTLDVSGTSQMIEGKVEFLKPDHLRIEHFKPERQTVVSDGKAIWVYRRSSNQVIQSDLADWKKADPMINSLLDFGGYSALAKRYDVSYSSGTREVTLTPKEKGAAYTLRLRLSTGAYFPVETELALAHMRIRTTLEDLEFNPAIPETEFAFTPPPGADIFRNFKPPRLQP